MEELVTGVLSEKASEGPMHSALKSIFLSGCCLVTGGGWPLPLCGTCRGPPILGVLLKGLVLLLSIFPAMGAAWYGAYRIPMTRKWVWAVGKLKKWVLSVLVLQTVCWAVWGWLQQLERMDSSSLVWSILVEFLHVNLPEPTNMLRTAVTLYESPNLKHLS